MSPNSPGYCSPVISLFPGSQLIVAWIGKLKCFYSVTTTTGGLAELVSFTEFGSLFAVMYKTLETYLDLSLKLSVLSIPLLFMVNSASGTKDVISLGSESTTYCNSQQSYGAQVKLLNLKYFD